jgi:DNA polymerase III alpha subunit
MYLNTHSQFSLRYGTMDIKTLVTRARGCGVEQLALTDINNSSGMMEFVRAANKEGIKPIAGMAFHRDKQLLYLGIARNREGFRELNEFLTHHNVNHLPLPDKPHNFENAYVIYPFTGNTNVVLKQNEYIGIRHEQLNFIFGKLLKSIKEKLVALCPVTVADKIEYKLHEYLRAIDLNTLLTKVDDNYKCRPGDMLLHIDDICEKFAMYPYIISNTEKLMRSCSIKVPNEKSRNKKTFTGSMEGDYKRLRELTLAGMAYRYGDKHEKALKKIEEELLVIRDMGFAPYFLITHDITSHFMEKGYYHVGRGSGANSTVAYCLRITDVDPMELDLYFERFLNKSRTSPPDFDIDYSWDQRTDVQNYIFEKYGHQHVRYHEYI